MSERMPVEDVIGPAAMADPWTCPRCGRVNKATWAQCPACESDRAGLLPNEREPKRRRSRSNPINVILGLLIIAALVVLVVLVAEPVWDWAVESWNSFIAWVDARINPPD